MRLLALLLLFLPNLLSAQGAATLVADTVVLDSQSRLIAAGNIEVFYDGTRLSAARITYDRQSDRLTIEGPIFIQSPDGTILTAELTVLPTQWRHLDDIGGTSRYGP